LLLFLILLIFLVLILVLIRLLGQHIGLGPLALILALTRLTNVELITIGHSIAQRLVLVECHQVLVHLIFLAATSLLVLVHTIGPVCALVGRRCYLHLRVINNHWLSLASELISWSAPVASARAFTLLDRLHARFAGGGVTIVLAMILAWTTSHTIVTSVRALTIACIATTSAIITSWTTEIAIATSALEAIIATRVIIAELVSRRATLGDRRRVGVIVETTWWTICARWTVCAWRTVWSIAVTTRWSIVVASWWTVVVTSWWTIVITSRWTITITSWWTITSILTNRSTILASAVRGILFILATKRRTITSGSWSTSIFASVLSTLRLHSVITLLERLLSGGIFARGRWLALSGSLTSSLGVLLIGRSRRLQSS